MTDDALIEKMARAICKSTMQICGPGCFEEVCPFCLMNAEVALAVVRADQAERGVVEISRAEYDELLRVRNLDPRDPRPTTSEDTVYESPALGNIDAAPSVCCDTKGGGNDSRD